VEMHRSTRLTPRRALPLERQRAPLDAQLQVLPADAGQLRREHEEIPLLAQVGDGGPSAEALGARVAAAPQGVLEQAIQPIFEPRELADRIPGRGRRGAPGPARALGAHRFDSSTSTYSASITSPSRGDAVPAPPPDAGPAPSFPPPPAA